MKDYNSSQAKRLSQFCCFICLVALVFSSSIAAAENTKKTSSVHIKPGSIYDRPYSFDENIIDKEMLKRNTISLVGAGVITLAALYAMPSSVTNWEDTGSNPFEKWWKNVKKGPVWDKDDFWLNYIAHPYVGAVYYMGARSAGANAWYSFLYSFALSTFFWEYGIESFAEVPSTQDLIVTPVAGAIIGEGFYLAKRHILENNYELDGSQTFGRTVVILMDPISEVSDMIWGEEKKDNAISMHSLPMVTPSGHMGYKLSFSMSF